MINRLLNKKNILLLLLLAQLSVKAQEKTITPRVESIQGIFLNSIRSVEFFTTDYRLGFPVINMGSEETITLKFDNISQEQKDLHYRVTHCDKEWKPSNLIYSEYINGFQENPLLDFEYSQGTLTEYINYMLVIPNQEIDFKLSGNYLLEVYDTDDPETTILSRKFYIVDHKVSINQSIKVPSFDIFNGTFQELDTEIGFKNVPISSPSRELTVVATQNGRDDLLRTLKHNFIESDAVIYNNNKSTSFKGGNEFRVFELKDLKGRAMNVANIVLHENIFHANLMRNIPRRAKEYMDNEDLNGQFYIESYRRDDSDLESEYIATHFTLELPEPLWDSDVYIHGALSDWNCSEIFKMEWDASKSCYRSVVLLKQGIYNYQYVYIEKESNSPKSELFESSYYRTENSYQTFVYYSGFGSKYDELVGFNILKSR